MENQKNNQLQIELKDEVAQGTYANLAIITHSSSEFIVDFVRVMPAHSNCLPVLRLRLPTNCSSLRVFSSATSVLTRAI